MRVCPISFLKKVVLWNTLTTNASITLTILTKTTPEHWSAAPVWAGGKNRLLWKSHTRLGTASTVTHFNRPWPIVVIIIVIVTFQNGAQLVLEWCLNYLVTFETVKRFGNKNCKVWCQWLKLLSRSESKTWFKCSILSVIEHSGIFTEQVFVSRWPRSS